MTETKGQGGGTAETQNAKAAKDGGSNPRQSACAQAELGGKGGGAAAETG